MQEEFQAAERFVTAFIEAEHGLWAANYTLRDAQRLQLLFDSFAQRFFSFPAMVLISRPTAPDEPWFTGAAQEDLAVTFRRPLFKIERYRIGMEDVFAAYTGSTDEGSCAYYEVLVFQSAADNFRIFAVYHPDFEGGLRHFQGEA